MTEPVLLLASAGEIGRFGSGFTDFGLDYTMRVRTIELAPAGAGGVAEFPSMYVVITFDVPFKIRLSPILDGVPLWDESVDIEVTEAPADGMPQTHLWQVVMDRPRLRNGVEVSRYYLMGSWFQAEAWMPCPSGIEGIIDLERVEVEAGIVSKSGGAQ